MAQEVPPPPPHKNRNKNKTSLIDQEIMETYVKHLSLPKKNIMITQTEETGNAMVKYFGKVQ